MSLYFEALVPLFHKPLQTSSIKFFGLLSEPGGDFPFYSFIVGKMFSLNETLQNFKREVLEHPPYSPDLAPSDFHLFGPLKYRLSAERTTLHLLREPQILQFS
jgi:hypothetical protein